MNIIEWLKVILLGIVEGITEWLPISSTGHMILVDEFIKLNVTADFKLSSSSVQSLRLSSSISGISGRFMAKAKRKARAILPIQATTRSLQVFRTL
mgnify:CR=1 FL=1